MVKQIVSPKKKLSASDIEAVLSEDRRKRGSNGGKTTFDRHGVKHFTKISKKGVRARKQISVYK